MVRPSVYIRKRIVAMKKKIMFILSALLCVAASSFGASVANPAAQIPDARLAVGVSYFLGGSTITDKEIPMMMNRLCARVSYSPIRYVNVGFDFGTAQVSVDQYTEDAWDDTIPVFNGDFGWSVGGHLKLSTPFFFDYVALFGLANGNFFRSTNKLNAYYGGKDGVGVVGAQIRIPNVGYVSIGPQVYLIMGDNRGYAGQKGTYSNINNIRGWLAFDYFPEMGDFSKISELAGDNKPYVSVEFTMSPKIGGSARVPIQEFSLSVSIGVITQRLYGVDKEADF
jgi:hypothetical protein